jgi:hypothetical protein
MMRSAITPFLFLCFMLAALAAKADACGCVTMMEGTHPYGSGLHAEPVSVTVGKKTMPVTLIINQQGYNNPSPPKKTP